MFKKIIEKLYLKQKGNLAYYDGLTGLHNRLYYEKVLKRKYLKSEFYVTILDINDLKKINDTQGHLAGDKIIIETVDIIKTEDFIDAFRFGGDEFVVFSEYEIPLSQYSWLFSYGVHKKLSSENLDIALEAADKELIANKELK